MLSFRIGFPTKESSKVSSEGGVSAMNKSAFRVWMALCVCLLLTCLISVPLLADEEKDWVEAGYAQVVANTAIRSKKNNKSLASIVKIVPKGQVVEVTKDAGKGWYRVSFGSKSGFILGDYLTDEDDEDLSDNHINRVLAVDVTLRASAKVTSENALGVLRAGTTVAILGERADNFVHIEYESGDSTQDAYIRNGFFISDPKCGSGYSWKYAAQDLYIRSSPSVSSTNVVGTLKKGKKVKVVGVSGNWYKVRFKRGVRYVKEGYFTTEAKPDYVSETIASRINFRSSATTTKDNIIRVLTPGTVVHVIKSVSKNWYEIKAGTSSGYVMGGYFTSDVPEDEPEYSMVTRTTTAALRMRSGRGTSYSVITVIPKGASVTLSMKYGDWYRVRYTAADGTTYTGWVSGAYLTET